jgi:hypothetical protein
MSDKRFIDPQELTDRAEAATAYGIEDPSLYVDWAHDCIIASEQATRNTRYLWDQCLQAYKGHIDYSEKEEWQAKMTTGDMNATVKQGVAVIRKALRQPDWYTVEPQGKEDETLANFIRESFAFWLSPQQANFSANFCDASELGLAIGQSHEIIPQWVPGRGLIYTLVPPWQVHRDPDASSRDPWSGDYWAHVEWMDLWKVKRFGPKYVRLDEVTANESAWGQETQEKRFRRKNQYYSRTAFRHAVRVVEFWGVVLDKNGDLLLPDARFTVAGDVLIRNPEPNPFITLRWPGISFSPLPDLFSFDGHGIIETSLLLWLNTCNLMSLHMDDLSWRVNKLREIDRMDLEDPTDVAMFPGKTVFRSPRAKTPPGQSVVKEVFSSQSTNEALATLQHWDQRRENSSFVNQFVAGQRGTRTQITKGEVEIKTGQSMTIFDSIGEDVEEGGMNVLKATKEILLQNWSELSKPTITRILNSPAAIAFSQLSLDQRKELLHANCDVKVQGVSAQIKNSELVPRYQALMKQAESTIFGKYFRPYSLLKKQVNSFGFYDADFIVSEQEAQALDAQPPPSQLNSDGAPLTPGAPNGAPAASGVLAPGEGGPINA